MSDRQRETLNGTEYEGMIELPPRHITVTKLSVVFHGFVSVIGNVVMINSFCFIVSVFPLTLSRPDKRRAIKETVKGFDAEYKGVYMLDSRLNRIRMMASQTDIRKMKKDSLELYKEAYNEFFERRRKKLVEEQL